MASSKSMKVLVFLGSVRDGRMVERVGKFVTEKLKAAQHDVEVFGNFTITTVCFLQLPKR